MRRYISPSIVYKEFTGIPSIIEVENGKVENLYIFQEELPNTIYLAGPVIIIKKENLNEFLLDDVELLLASKILWDEKLSLINDLLKQANLYPNHLSKEDVIAIEISNGTSRILR